MKVFEIDYLDIALDDLPPKGEPLVCLDPQKRLGEKTWSVLISEGRNNVADAIGLFWNREDAIFLALQLEL